MVMTAQSKPKPKPPTDLVALRCPSCGKLLANVRLTAGAAVEVRCHRCRAIVRREAPNPES